MVQISEGIFYPVLRCLGTVFTVNKTNGIKIMKNCLIGVPTDNLLQPIANFTIISIALLLIKLNIFM